MKRSIQWVLGSIAALALLAAACSPLEDSPAPSPSPTAGIPAETPTPGENGIPPEIASLLADVAELRQLDPPANLEAHVIPRSEVAALLDELTTDAEREGRQKITTLYRLLGHFDLDQDYDSIWDAFGTEAVAGLYSPSRKTLWVVSDSGSFEDLTPRQRSTLAHELVHALQDYHFDLNAVHDGIAHIDEELAWTAVIEGDAEVHQAAFDRGAVVRTATAGIFLSGELHQITGVPPSFLRELLFPYTTGRTWAEQIVEAGGTSALDAFIAEPPVGTSIILHPERIATGWAPQIVSLPDLLPALGSGWEHESGGTLGEFRWMNYLQMGVTGVTAARAANGWDGDVYDVYVNENTGESVAAFRLAFRDDDEAAEFRDAHEAFIANMVADTTTSGDLVITERRNGVTTISQPAASGSEVVLVMGSNVEIAIATMEALLSG